MESKHFPDGFKEAREESDVVTLTYPGETLLATLTLKEVRKAAKNWKNFTSDAQGKVPIPEETSVRDVRQLPIELDPPDHTSYRSLVEPTFKRPLDPEFQVNLNEIIQSLIEEVFSQDSVEIVSDFALPLQSRALTLLLNLPLSESDIWVEWGTHVFRTHDGGELDKGKASNLDNYVRRKIAEAKNSCEEDQDFFSTLSRAKVNGRSLSDKEIEGIANLTFAGGRDTVINLITNAIWVFAELPDIFERLKNEPEIIGNAIEEFVRFFSPLSQIGRVAKEDTQICEHAIKAGDRISLCWASANRDETVFKDANKLVVDRKQNPHVGFGFGVHNCLGATHARQLMRLLIPCLIETVEKFEIQNCQENIEDLAGFKRKGGFESLQVKISLKNR